MTEDETTTQICDLCGEATATCPHCTGDIVEARADRLYATFGTEPQEYFIALPKACQYYHHAGHTVYIDLKQWQVKIHCPVCHATSDYPLEPRLTTVERAVIDRTVRPSPYNPSESTARRRKSGATTHRWYAQRGIA